ncbi:Alpha/Beta hydrolase protein [Globomyces pollinis-pini]|nr:Alpha/Beta hydrolase protein [Globomyces pollinis-pini]
MHISSLLLSLYALVAPTQAVRFGKKPVMSTIAQYDFPLYMQFSSAAYCDKLFSSSTPAFNCGARCDGAVAGTILKRSVINKRTEAAGYVGYNHKLKIVIASFRGSSNVQNWLNNIQVWISSVDDWGVVTPALLEDGNKLVPSKAKVHAGFEKGYLSIRTEIQRCVQSLAVKYPTYKIIFTGHSLGGALATMAAADFVENFGVSYGDRISLYTYGQPRVGNREWAEYVQKLPFASRMYRIQHRRDIVVQFPAQVMKYVHSGHQYTLSEDNKTTRACKTSGPAGESKACLKDDRRLLGIATHTTYYNYKSKGCA